jgi:hypothetical protein
MIGHAAGLLHFCWKMLQLLVGLAVLWDLNAYWTTPAVWRRCNHQPGLERAPGMDCGPPCAGCCASSERKTPGLAAQRTRLQPVGSCEIGH